MDAKVGMWDGIVRTPAHPNGRPDFAAALLRGLDAYAQIQYEIRPFCWGRDGRHPAYGAPRQAARKPYWTWQWNGYSLHLLKDGSAVGTLAPIGCDDIVGKLNLAESFEAEVQKAVTARLQGLVATVGKMSYSTPAGEVYKMLRDAAGNAAGNAAGV